METISPVPVPLAASGLSSLLTQSILNNFVHLVGSGKPPVTTVVAVAIDLVAHLSQAPRSVIQHPPYLQFQQRGLPLGHRY